MWHVLWQVGHVVEVLRSCNHQAFPVTPDVDKAFESAEPFDLHGKLRPSGPGNLIKNASRHVHIWGRLCILAD